MAKLFTKRLILETIKESDAVDYCRLLNDHDVMRYLGGPSRIDINYYRKSIKAFAGFPGVFIARIRDNNQEFVGRCAISERKELFSDLPAKIELNVVLAINYWGKGLGTEILNRLIEYSNEIYPGLKVVAKVHRDNSKSIKMMESIGMKKVTENGISEKDNIWYVL